jgi:exonuclease-1
MGIENLLNFLKPALQERSIVDYRGKTAAVDAMSWLYRGCYSCAYDLN